MSGPRGGRSRQQWCRPRRSKRAAAWREGAEAELQAFFEEALTLQPALSTFEMHSPSGREELAQHMWKCCDLLGDTSMTASNRELAAILNVLMHNSYRRDVSSEYQTLRTGFRVESILVNLQRAQSQKKMPLLTARFSVACLRAQLPHKLWEIFSLCLPGLLASHKWTQDFVAFASERRAPCKYEVLSGVGGVLFDNYTRKVLYSSKATVESHGFLLNMTNWGTVQIPRLVAPPNFNLEAACAPLPLVAHTFPR